MSPNVSWPNPVWTIGTLNQNYLSDVGLLLLKHLLP